MKCIKITTGEIAEIKRIDDEKARQLIKSDPDHIHFIPKKVWKKYKKEEIK